MRTRGILLLVLVLGLLMGAVVLVGLSFLSSKSYPQVWKGYYTVLVSDGQSVGEVQHRLEAQGLTVMTARNTLVSFNDFSSESTVSVSRLSERFVSLDPRFDAYLKGLGGYFNPGRWEIYYVESRSPLPVAYIGIARALSGLPWRIADFTWERTLLCLIMWALVTAFVLVRTRRSATVSYSLLIGALSSLSAPMSGDYTGALAAALLVLGWSTAVDLGHPMLRYYLDFHLLERERLAPIAATLLASLLAVAVLAGIEPRLIGYLLRESFVLLLITAALAVFELFSYLNRQHRLFFPVRIAEGRKSAASTIPRLAGTIWIVMVLFASPGIAFLSWGADVEIPTPVVYPGVARNTWAGLQTMWDNGAHAGLPDLADYVVHRAYQAGLSYGVHYVFPAPNERVQEMRYSRDGKRIVGRLAVVKVYTEDWFRETLAGGDGIVRMLENQEGAVLPVKRRLYDMGYPTAFVPVFCFVILGLLLPALFLRRGGAFDTVGRMCGTVTVTHEEARRTLSLPPPRRRQRVFVRDERRDLVPESD